MRRRAGGRLFVRKFPGRPAFRGVRPVLKAAAVKLGLHLNGLYSAADVLLYGAMRARDVIMPS